MIEGHGSGALHSQLSRAARDLSAHPAGLPVRLQLFVAYRLQQTGHHGGVNVFGLDGGQVVGIGICSIPRLSGHFRPVCNHRAQHVLRDFKADALGELRWHGPDGYDFLILLV